LTVDILAALTFVTGLPQSNPLRSLVLIAAHFLWEALAAASSALT
jgi:hypothetical protein